jgi:hypothetical protein
VAQNKEFVFNTAELVVIAVPSAGTTPENRRFDRMGKTSTSRCLWNGLCEMQTKMALTNHPWINSTIKTTWSAWARQPSKVGDMILFYLALLIKQERTKRIA